FLLKDISAWRQEEPRIKLPLLDNPFCTTATPSSVDAYLKVYSTDLALLLNCEIQDRLLKGKFTPKSKIHISPLTCSAIYQSRLIWCELPSVGDIGHRDVCLFSIKMELDGTQPKKEIHLKNLTAISLSRNHDLVTQDNPQTLL
ncbi:hypothetical protein P7M45_23995, partial [Vibrio parahaemolyticus]|nr:hypothetical protein [Vibrio parahaemolyticus]